MKTIFTAVVLMAAFVFILSPAKTFAGSNDTLVVYANGKSLDEIILSDSTSTGMQAHKVYKLVSLDTTYIFLGAITVKSDFQVVGALGANKRPPCIQPGVRGDGSIALNLFVMNGPNTKVVFKNLYLLGLSTNNTTDWASALEVNADNIKLTVDNVVFEAWWMNAIGYRGNAGSFFITNCKFRNLAQPSWYSGEVLRNITGSATSDSIVMKYNTVFCVNAYAACPVTKSMVNYFDFSHNSVIWMFKNPFWIFNVTNAKINDNIFYGTWAGGISLTEYPWWDQLWSEEIGSIIDLDSLDIAKAKIFDPQDSAKANIRWLAEAKRKIEIKNNVYFTPASFNSFVKAWNDTAHVDSVITNEWMNKRTKGILADKTHWPGIIESGTKNVDPGFGQSILDILDDGKGNGIGLKKYFTEIRTGVSSTNYWGYKVTTVGTNANWVPTWPLPEMKDLQYTNTALLTGGTDGKAVGDPGWFTNGYTGVEKTSSIVPTKFALYDAYPNPFNPSTNIKFGLSNDGNISLKVYNIMGQLVRTVLNNEFTSKGEHIYNVNMNNLSSGVYYYTLTQGSQQITKKMLLIK